MRRHTQTRSIGYTETQTDQLTDDHNSSLSTLTCTVDTDIFLGNGNPRTLRLVSFPRWRGIAFAGGVGFDLRDRVRSTKEPNRVLSEVGGLLLPLPLSLSFLPVLGGDCGKWA